MRRYVAAIDQGTTSSRCIVFDRQGRIVGTAQREHRQIFPKPGWVEHDPAEVWRNTEWVLGAALGNAGCSAGDLAAIGITNQRETTVVWDRATGAPVYNAIVWQDTRTDQLCAELAGDQGPQRYAERTGLPLSTYFAGPKLRWILDNVAGVRARAEAGDLCFGTMDSWVLWKLTGEHLTDVTNASRTMLMDLRTLQWDSAICAEFDIPMSLLPRIRSSSEVYAEITAGPFAGAPVA
ncbi:FGGY family carbohydrate kinase, partial [Nocardia sp. MH4]